MSLNKISRLIIILFFIVAVVSLAFYARDTQNKVKKTLFAMQTNYENIRSRLFDMQDAQHYRLISEKGTLPESLHILPENQCILRIHDVSCLGCYAENLIRFSQMMASDSLSFFVLGTYSNKKQFALELSGIMSLDSIENFNIQRYGILPVDSINRPYLFIKTVDNKASYIYIFEKGEYRSLNEYVQMLKR